MCVGVEYLTFDILLNAKSLKKKAFMVIGIQIYTFKNPNTPDTNCNKYIFVLIRQFLVDFKDYRGTKLITYPFFVLM